MQRRKEIDRVIISDKGTKGAYQKESQEALQKRRDLRREAGQWSRGKPCALEAVV